MAPVLSVACGVKQQTIMAYHTSTRQGYSQLNAPTKTAAGSV
jgi:hypothetical protein